MVCHEVDHLFGVLHRARMRAGAEPIPVPKHRRPGQQWTYLGTLTRPNQLEAETKASATVVRASKDRGQLGKIGVE